MNTKVHTRSHLKRVNSLDSLISESHDCYVRLFSGSSSVKTDSARYFGNFHELPRPVVDRFKLPNKAPQVFLSKYSDCIVLGDSVVITKDGFIAKDCIINNRFFNEKCLKAQENGAFSVTGNVTSPEEIDGDFLFLSSFGLIGAYTHWLTEIMPRAVALLNFKKTDRKIKILIDSKVSQYQLNMLKKMGVGGDDLFIKDRSKSYKFKSLYIVSPMATVWLHPKIFNVYDILSDNIVMKNVGSIYKKMGDKIFVDRLNLRGKRTLVNFEKIRSISQDNGYQLVAPENMNIDEKMFVFQKARKIIGEAGGGMINIVFSNKDMKSLIISSDAFPSPIFSNISSIKGSICNYIIGTSIEDTFGRHDNNSNFVVSENQFLLALKDLEEQ